KRCSQAPRLNQSSRAHRDKPSFITCHGSRGDSAGRGGALRGAATGSAAGIGSASVAGALATSTFPATLRAGLVAFLSATPGLRLCEATADAPLVIAASTGAAPAVGAAGGAAVAAAAEPRIPASPE